MMTIDDIIKNRRSVRQFTDKVIPHDMIMQILDAGRHAPSACNRQPWHFYALVSDEAKDKIRSCYGNPWFRSATTYILVTGFPHDAWRFKDDKASSTHIDSAIATTQMMLKAYELGIASTWVCAFDREKCCELFGLDFDIEEPISILALGYPNTENPASRPFSRKEMEEITSIL